MDVGTIMAVAQTLVTALQYTHQLNDICSIIGYKSKLQRLSGTVAKIESVLEDAEAKQGLPKQEQLYIQDLKDAVYDADDLFDEFVTLAEQNKRTKGNNKFRVLSLFTKLGTAYNMTQGVKKIEEKLNAIVFNNQFNLKIDPNPIKNRRLETSSYVDEADIIGRELDLEKIVNVLLNTNVQVNISFLSIVGIAGLGKTALAQLVYNDARVIATFSPRLWTCVADENQELLDVQGVLSKILASATDHKNHKKYEGCTMDGLQSQLQAKLAGKKFLLVLDDVWTENYERWHTLTQSFMEAGEKGSCIVVTTCSRETARIIGGSLTHELLGLSKEDSWCLFKKAAFSPNHSNLPRDLVKIGQDIVEECANVPLAIRVLGSLLFGQEQNKWHSIQKLGLAKVNGKENSIMPTLKLSYYQLEPPLKSCFSYCAMFPKDFEMEKDTLIRLWMAQGYIPLNDSQSPEDLAEEYFSILLRRCFFQDIKKDENCNVMSCKIHDLMHDVAHEVVGKEICRVETMNGDVDKKVRHLSLIQSKSTNYVSSKSHVRSYLQFGESCRDVKKMDQLCLESLLANWKFLRALCLSSSDIKSLPASIGDLIHLRYLDLSYNVDLEVLHGSVTKLCNLQTLILKWCTKLKELPKDLSKLVKLRVLDLQNCYELNHMPKGMGDLTCLHTLNWFVLGKPNSCKNKLFDVLEDLKALKNLKGYLEIGIHFMKTAATACKINGEEEGGCLGNKEHLNHVFFDFSYGEEKERKEYDEAVMEVLQPLNSSLKRITVKSYHGVRMPHWPGEDNLATFLLNLVEIRFIRCRNLQHLGQLQLPWLKIVYVHNCPNLTAILECPALEYLDLVNFNERLVIIPISGASTSSTDDLGPKLREIRTDNVAWLNSLPMDSYRGVAKLNIGWDRKVESLGEVREVFHSCSSSLQSLSIGYCDNLKSIVCGGLEQLCALEDLEIRRCPDLSQSEEIMRVHSFCQSLCSLISFDLPLVELPDWIQYLKAIQTLEIFNCKSLKCMPSWMSKLTSLRALQLTWYSSSLKERCQRSTGEDWPHIKHIPYFVSL
ncbi:putative disease resistance protein RGA1 [Chenopodium quinoa]|uniref:putative disease resistance protein RGA1 n=1 Tax=Chenopodium quinoa TaxID=63459 RepID=UPI000B787E58|nr:putative disease resistance protein RGA1 [Chenopodium quinoa]